MAVETILLVGYLGAIATLFAFATLKFWLLIQRLREEIPSSIQAIIVGRPAMLVGKVSAPSASFVDSPYSKNKCICFTARVEQKTSHFNVRSGFSKPAWESLGSSVRSAPFVVSDQTGSLFVVASRAQMSLSSTLEGELDILHEFKVVRRGLRWFAKRFSPIQTLWVKESLLRDGDAVFVSGIARPISAIDRQLVPPRFRSQVEYVLKGDDVNISTTIQAAHIPFYEKWFWFCFISTGACIMLLVALLVLF